MDLTPQSASPLLRGATFADAGFADIQAIILGVPSDFQVRAAFALAVPSVVAQYVPEALPQFRAFHASFPQRPPFGFMPARDATQYILFIAWLMYPNKDLWGACAAMIERSMALFTQIPVIRPLIAACERDLGQFIELIGTNNTFYSRGAVSVKRVNERTARLTFEDIPFFFLRLTLEGFWKGIFTLFGVQGSVRLDMLDEHCAEVTLSWR